MGQSRPRDAGFTLIEIVVSLLIFAVLSVLAWQGLYQIVRVEERSRVQSVAQNEINHTWALLVQDLLHLRSRPVRNSFGDLEDAYTTSREPYQVIFSRGGLPTLAGIFPNGMQRVAYFVNEEQDLVRRTWRLEDGYREEDGHDQIVLHEVTSLIFEQLDASNYYQPNWPPINESLEANQVPRMLRINLTLTSGVQMTRVLPGIQSFVGNQNGPNGPNGQNGRNNRDGPNGGGNR